MSPEDAAGLSDPRFDQPTDVPTRLDLVLGHFEPQSINLLAGDPYIGKTRLMLCEANRYRSSGVFIGRRDGQAIPSRIGMMVRKHDLRNVQKIIKSCQLSHIATPQTFPIVPLRSISIDGIVEAFHDFGKPRPSVLFIDIPIQSFAEGNINEAATADHVYSRLREFCAQESVTIWAIATTVKRKMNEGYARSSQTISGTGGWSMGSDVSMFTDLPERCMDETSRQRRLLINAHHDEAREIYLEFASEGTISIIATPPEWEEILATCLAEHPEDEPIRTSQIKFWGANARISGRQIERWIREMSKAKVLVPKRKGVFVKGTLHHA
jgi:hypothetical protein